MNPFLKKPTLWKVGLIFLIFGIISIVAALVGGEDSSALLFGGEFPPAAQIVGGAAVAALGVFFLVRSRKEEEYAIKNSRFTVCKTAILYTLRLGPGLYLLF